MRWILVAAIVLITVVVFVLQGSVMMMSDVFHARLPPAWATLLVGILLAIAVAAYPYWGR